MNAEVSCLSADGEILGSTQVSVIADGGCLYVAGGEVRVQIKRCGRVARLVAYFPALDTSVELPVRSDMGEMSRGDTVTLVLQRKVLAKVTT